MNHVALVLELFDELAELFGEAVHGALEAGQQVKRHDDGEADAGDCGQQILFHEDHLTCWAMRKGQASSSTSTLRMLAPL